MKKDVLLFLGSLGRISPFERGTTTYGEPEVFIAVQPPAPSVPQKVGIVTVTRTDSRANDDPSPMFRFL